VPVELLWQVHSAPCAATIAVVIDPAVTVVRVSNDIGTTYDAANNAANNCTNRAADYCAAYGTGRGIVLSICRERNRQRRNDGPCHH